MQDIMSKRGITRKEMEQQNPGVDLNHLSANQVLEAPPHAAVRQLPCLLAAALRLPEMPSVQAGRAGHQP